MLRGEGAKGQRNANFDLPADITCTKCHQPQQAASFPKQLSSCTERLNPLPSRYFSQYFNNEKYVNQSRFFEILLIRIKKTE